MNAQANAKVELQAKVCDAWVTIGTYTDQLKAARAFRDFCDPDLDGFEPARLLQDGTVTNEYTPPSDHHWSPR